MPALDFPANPTNGQLYPAAPNAQYIYNATAGGPTTGAWESLPMESAKTVTADVPPADPKDGDQWFNTIDGTLYIYIVDIDGGQWVESQAPITANGYYSPNYIINGGFDIWQRASTYTGSVGGFATADRWYMSNGASSTFAKDTSVLAAGTAASMKITAGASAAYSDLYQPIETSMAKPLAGKTVTLSAYVSSSAATTPSLIVYSSTSVDASVSTGLSGTNISATTFNIPTSSGIFNRITATFTVPANMNSLLIRLSSGNLASGVNLYWGGVQLEEGTIATTFRRNANSIQGELAACQRYYQRLNEGTGVYRVFATGWAYSTTGVEFFAYLPVPLRTGPTAIDTSALSTIGILDNVSTYTPTVITFSSGQSGTSNVTISATVASGLTAFRPYFIRAQNNASAYIGLSAEL